MSSWASWSQWRPQPCCWGYNCPTAATGHNRPVCTHTATDDAITAPLISPDVFTFASNWQQWETIGWIIRYVVWDDCVWVIPLKGLKMLRKLIHYYFFSSQIHTPLFSTSVPDDRLPNADGDDELSSESRGIRQCSSHHIPGHYPHLPLPAGEEVKLAGTHSHTQKHLSTFITIPRCTYNERIIHSLLVWFVLVMTRNSQSWSSEISVWILLYGKSNNFLALLWCYSTLVLVSLSLNGAEGGFTVTDAPLNWNLSPLFED